MAEAGKLAILAGGGALPGQIAAAAEAAGRPVTLVAFAGTTVEAAGFPVIAARIEKLGALFADLRAAGVTHVVMAGGMRRPALDPAGFDDTFLAVAPRLMAAMQGGDDGLLRVVIAVFEEAGFTVEAPHDLVPALTAAPGFLTATAPGHADRADADRAAEIVQGLGALDIGQGAVVAQGLCLGVETVQGTDAMLRFVAETARGARPNPDGARGVLLKMPKPGQDLRVDMPAIGPETVRGAAAAGLAGIVLAAGRVLVLERDETLAAAEAAGLFVWARDDI
ncbi:LpxI family protein [Rhodovulum sp. YNF3179]|uniref:LpxI family protein n=1 Tax=Rhodovulum sp. YNF3179 TaxID=3425127 RepID=UPI003D336A2D